MKHPAAKEVKAPRFTYSYLWATAGITAALGVFLVVFPAWIGRLFFGVSSHEVEFFVRMLGSTLFGYGSLNALAARDGSRRVCYTAVWANLATLLTACVISIAYVPHFTGYAWLVIGQHIIFAAGFIYCAWELRRAT